MDVKKCSVLTGGKQCGLAVTLVQRELETGTAVYECPHGHRTYIPVAKMEYRRCPVFVNGKECGLSLMQVQREFETGTRIYECAQGHRTYMPMEPDPATAYDC